MNNERLKLTISQFLTHYGIVIALLFIVSLTVWNFLEIFVTKTYAGVRTTNELIRTALPFFLLAVVFSYIQYRRLKFQVVSVILSDEQFLEVIELMTNELDLRVEHKTKAFFRAYRRWNWSGSWGEMITIVKAKDRILINSICDPDSMISVFSYGNNKKNINTFLKNLNTVLCNKAGEVKIEKVENEWNFKRVLIRLLMYPFCFSLIVLGVYMIFEPLTLKTIIAGFGIITISTIYLVSDLKIVLLKRNK